MSVKLEAGAVLEAQRFFAVDCNNRAWALAETLAAQSHPDELLNLAHASAFHWQAIGTELEKMRALMLLANVHALLGMGVSALRYAQQMRSFFLTQTAVPDWELAFVHTIHAHACACAGGTQGHAESYAKAQMAISTIADPQDKAIVLITFAQVPIPT